MNFISLEPRTPDPVATFFISTLKYITIPFLTLLLLGSNSLADYKEDIGYTALQAELGASIPDGSSISLVTQAEAATLLDHDGDDQTEMIPVWMPDPGHFQFSGKTIFDRTGSPAFYSGHATSVGTQFYGSTGSIAPGLNAIESYLADHWLGEGFLRGGNILKPLFTASRVANHSWIGQVVQLDAMLLRRLDWLISVDEYPQIVGPCRSNNPLLGSAFNAIAVGQATGESGSGSISVDTVYTAGRTCPQLIAPRGSASSAIPVVASGAALLIDLGHSNPGLSTDPIVQQTTNRNGDTLYNAERSEVVKAALMAGADRVTRNTVIIDGVIPNIIDYRVDPGDKTANGLDRRYGAGQINIHNSYYIVAGEEQNAKEDQAVSGGIIGSRGFDYDPSFGGDGGSNVTASYYFASNTGLNRLWASLVWNIEINGGAGSDFDGATSLNDLDLFLYDVTAPEDPQLMSASTDSAGSTENLWFRIKKPGNYMIQVRPGLGQAPFNWDYALAWRIGRPTDNDTDSMGDDWEVENGLDPLTHDSFEDTDGDDASNLKEYLSGTDPQNDLAVPGILVDTDFDMDTDGNDLATCITEFDVCDSQSGCSSPCDFDQNGSVNEIDLFLIAEDFGKTG